MQIGALYDYIHFFGNFLIQFDHDDKRFRITSFNLKFFMLFLNTKKPPNIMMLRGKNTVFLHVLFIKACTTMKLISLLHLTHRFLLRTSC